MGARSRKGLEPWKQDRRAGAKFAVFALVAGAVSIAWVEGGYYQGALGAGVVATGLAGAAVSRFKRAGNREFGKQFEREHVARAIATLPRSGFQVRANVVVPSVGDVDLVAYFKNMPITIEIKSFVKWNQNPFFRGERENKALAQSDRQRYAIKAKHGIVWLPQGRPNFLQRFFGVGSGNVRVVFGGERNLVRALKRLV